MIRTIDSFAQLATSYCSLVEDHSQFLIDDFIVRLRELLPLLYYHALALPDFESTHEDLPREISHDEWSMMFVSLQKTLGINDLYWEVFDPLKADPDHPVAASLSDDLCDIWRDLKDGLLDWGDCSATMRQTVVRNWHSSFHHHWSDHLVDAMRAINCITEHYGTRDTKTNA